MACRKGGLVRTSSEPRRCGALDSGLWFLHDGRTNNIVTAIEDHYSLGNSSYPASEANQVMTNFNSLSPKNQQDLVNFLRSL